MDHDGLAKVSGLACMWPAQEKTERRAGVLIACGKVGALRRHWSVGVKCLCDGSCSSPCQPLWHLPAQQGCHELGWALQFVLSHSCTPQLMLCPGTPLQAGGVPGSISCLVNNKGQGWPGNKNAMNISFSSTVKLEILGGNEGERGMKEAGRHPPKKTLSRMPETKG